MYRFLISLRYIRKRSTAVLATLAVTVGVATLLTVLSIFNGYIIRLREMIREQDAHLVIRGPSPTSLCGLEMIQEAVKKLEHVVETSPILDAPAMYRSGKYNPCYLRGIDPGRESVVTGLGKFLLRPEEAERLVAQLELPENRNVEDFARDLLAQVGRKPLSPQEAEALFSLEWRKQILNAKSPELSGKFLVPPHGVVVGTHLLTQRDLALGSVVRIITLDPRTRQAASDDFLVTGAFKTGNFEIDSKIFFISFNRMKTLLNTFDATMNQDCCEGIRIVLDDHEKASEVRKQLLQVLVELPTGTGVLQAQVLTWEDLKRNFLKAVIIEKRINGIVVSLLNIFTACVILLMLVLIVIEKTRDAGILLSLGATPWGVFSIFLWSGLIISSLGTIFGLLAGTLFIEFINPLHEAIYQVTGFKLFDPEVYLMDRIPTSISYKDVAYTILPAIGFGFLASLIPAIWAARKNPIQSIQHE